MSIVKVTELSASSEKSFGDAIEQGIARASKTIRGMKSAWVNEQHVIMEDGEIVEWRVNLKISFLLDA